MTTRPHRGWDAAQRLFAEERYEIEDLRCQITIPDLADALEVQIHPPPGLTCPSPDHYQTGDSAPASTWWDDGGIERWWCHACDIGGDLFDFVTVRGLADDFAGAMEVVASVVDGAPHSPGVHARPVPRYHDKHQEDPERLGRVRTAEGIEECEQYCASRGWDLLDLLGRHRWAYMYGDGGYWLRIYSDEWRTWWQDRALDGQTNSDGTPWRWRSPAGRVSQLFVWEPTYIERVKRIEKGEHPRHGPWRRKVTDEIDHTPAVPPLVLVVEGASDFVTAVVAQSWLDIGQRFHVVALPGVSNYRLLDFRSDWAVLLDNDEAGDQARQNIDADQEMPVRHLFVPEPFKDLSESWSDGIAVCDRYRDEWDLLDEHDRRPIPPWWDQRRQRIGQWINQLREALNPPDDTPPTEEESRHG